MLCNVKTIHELNIYEYVWKKNMSVTELLENLEEMFPGYCMHSDIFDLKTLTTQ